MWQFRYSIVCPRLYTFSFLQSEHEHSDLGRNKINRLNNEAQSIQASKPLQYTFFFLSFVASNLFQDHHAARELKNPFSSDPGTITDGWKLVFGGQWNIIQFPSSLRSLLLIFSPFVAVFLRLFY